MFGYVKVNKPELKIKDFDLYESFYCGLCKTLGREQGYLSKISLNYDMQFLAIMLSALYEPENQVETHRCGYQGLKKKTMIFNEYINYASEMTIVLTYLKCRDDWVDDRNVKNLTYGKILKSKYHKIKSKYPKKIEKIERMLNEIQEEEKLGNQDIEHMSNLFGTAMAEIYHYKDDEWTNQLMKFGRYLGKFIYVMDAYDDLEKDVKKKNYNPFYETYQQEDFATYVEMVLETMIATCSEVFEMLPILEYSDILANILYSGVWLPYDTVNERRKEMKDGSI